MADTLDLKSSALNGVWVRLPSSLLFLKRRIKMTTVVLFVFGVLAFVGLTQVLDDSHESVIPFTFAIILFIVALITFNPL